MKLTGSMEKDLGLALQYVQIDIGSLAFYLIECRRILQFIFRNQVYFIFALAVPPTADARAAVLLDQHIAEISFEHNAAESRIVPLDNRLDVIISFNF